MSIRVSIGCLSATSQRQRNVRGEAIWNEMLYLPHCVLPAEPSSMPDVFVYLCLGQPKTSNVVAYARLPVCSPLRAWLCVVVWWCVRVDGVFSLTAITWFTHDLSVWYRPRVYCTTSSKWQLLSGYIFEVTPPTTRCGTVRRRWKGGVPWLLLCW